MDELRTRVRELLSRAGLASMPPAVLIAACAISAAAIGVGLVHWWPRSGGLEVSSGSAATAVAPASADSRSAAGAGTSSRIETASEGAPNGGGDGADAVYVHVLGAVRRPGLYQLSGGARVADAVAKAGGLLGNAAERGLNLARKVTDGEQIVVPTQDEYQANPSPATAMGGAGPGASAASGGGPQRQAGAGTGAPVNINTADVALLDTLPGVGPSTAQKIVAEREANGPFSSPDDLARVSGIGPKKLEGLRDLVVTQ